MDLQNFIFWPVPQVILGILLTTGLLTTGGLHAAPYGPNGLETERTQPDGTQLPLRVFGDKFCARTESKIHISAPISNLWNR